MNILFVCMGNICRSPMAEGLFRHKVDSLGLSDQFKIDSAGMIGYHAGESPDARAQAKMKEYGIDISSQRARQFEITDFDDFDRIFAMDERNLSDIYDETPEVHYREKASLILDYTPEAETKSVPDPYYGNEDGFEKVYRLLDAALEKLIEDIRKDLK